MTPDPHRHLIAAHAALHDAEQRWPRAHRNLTDLQGGLPGIVAAWPTGHDAAARIDTNPRDPHDECRTALRAITHDTTSIIRTLRDILDITHPHPPIATTAGRLHYAIALIHLGTCSQLTPLAAPQAEDVHRWALEVRNNVARYTIRHPGEPAVSAPDDGGDDWCRHCKRHADTLNPVHRDRLCRWCYDYRAANRQMPPPALVAMHCRGERITTRVLTRYTRKGA